MIFKFKIKMTKLDYFIKDVGVDTPTSEIIKLLFNPIKTNVKNFDRCKKLISSIKYIETQKSMLDYKISKLSRKDFMPQNLTLAGMNQRLNEFNIQLNKNALKINRLKAIMDVNFMSSMKMVKHLQDIGCLEQVLLEVKSDKDLLIIYKEFRFAWSELYGKDMKT